MSNSPETELDLELHFLPAWAQQPADTARYAKHPGEERPEREDRGRPPHARSARFAKKPERRRDLAGESRPPHGKFKREERREPPAPLPEVNVVFRPDEKGVDSLARQIKMTGRAYPLFQIAQMILAKPERHGVTFSVVKKAEGQIAQPLFVCVLDETLWLSEDEAVRYALNRHFATFYQAERIQIEPPKGTYTFVAQCGMSGVILGPPNHHDYQNQLRKLHAERFSRVPFDVFKSRVKIVREEAVVKKWLEEQSFKTQYVCLNMPEPLRLNSREEVEKHFRETHQAIIIKSVESHTLSGIDCRSLREPALTRLLRQKMEDQRRFPLQLATTLSQQFAARGLQFFKVNKTITHVAVARPHYLDLEATPVSDGVQRVVDFINSHPKCTRRKLIESLVPKPAGEKPAVSAESAEAAASGQAPKAAVREPSPEETALIADLHWLVHQGHVIEFADGILETAKKPAPPRPPKPASAQVPEAAADDIGAGTSESATPPLPTVESAAGVESIKAEAGHATSAEEAPSATNEPKAPESVDTPPVHPTSEERTESESGAFASVTEKKEAARPQ